MVTGTGSRRPPGWDQLHTRSYTYLKLLVATAIFCALGLMEEVGCKLDKYIFSFRLLDIEFSFKMVLLDTCFAQPNKVDITV